MMGRSPRGVLSFLDWLCVSVCVFARVYVHGVCMNHYTQFFLSLPLLNLPPPPQQYMLVAPVYLMTPKTQLLHQLHWNTSC